MESRRKFLKQSALAAMFAPIAIDAFSAPSERKLKNFGFISGIIGRELEGDWKSVLKKAASYGYTEIETGNFLGESAESFLAYLNQIGMTLPVGGFEFKAQPLSFLHDHQVLSALAMHRPEIRLFLGSVGESDDFLQCESFP